MTPQHGYVASEEFKKSSSRSLSLSQPSHRPGVRRVVSPARQAPRPLSSVLGLVSERLTRCDPEAASTALVSVFSLQRAERPRPTLRRVPLRPPGRPR